MAENCLFHLASPREALDRQRLKQQPRVGTRRQPPLKWLSAALLSPCRQPRLAQITQTEPTHAETLHLLADGRKTDMPLECLVEGVTRFSRNLPIKLSLWIPQVSQAWDTAR